jgi:hypothetical protein
MAQRITEFNGQTFSDRIVPILTTASEKLDNVSTCRSIANDYFNIRKVVCSQVQDALDRLYFLLFIIMLLGVLAVALVLAWSRVPVNREKTSLETTTFPYRPMPVFGPFS